MWFNEIDGPIPGLTVPCSGSGRRSREIGQFDPALHHTEDQTRLPAAAATKCGSPEIHGRHDHDATLRTIFRKVFQRASSACSCGWYRSLPGRHGARAWSSATVLAAALSLPLPWLLGPVGALAPLAFVLLTIGLDRSMFHHAFASRGVGFGLYFTVVRLLVLLTTAVAAGIGVFQYLLTHRAAERSRPPTTAAATGGRPQTPRP